MRVLLLHALPLDGRMWDTAALGLADVVAVPSLYRLGDSIERWGSELAKLLTEPTLVVGCSVGGSCALEVARAAPDMVAGLVLIGAKAGVNPESDTRDEAVDLLRNGGFAEAWDRWWGSLFSPATPASVVTAARQQAAGLPTEELVTGVTAFHNRRDHTAWAAGWTKPLWVVSGADDHAPAPNVARQLAEAPNRRFTLVPNSGHYVNLEQPEAFGQIVADALAWATDQES